jgi:uncharacterized repeat protein (TIGR01451 family)
VALTNTGDSDLTAVTVSDPLVPDCNLGLSSLAAGGTSTYICTRYNVVTSFTNVISITGTPSVGADVSASDTAAVNVVSPAIQIALTPHSQSVLQGGTVSFTVALTNTGNSILTGVTVSDPLVSDCNRSLDSLAAGATSTYVCTKSNVATAFINAISVTGTPSLGAVVSASDTAAVTVVSPAIQIALTPHSQSVAQNGTVTFTVAVTNTGTSILTGVIVSDPLVSDCNRNLGSLAVGATSTYACAKSNVVTAFNNVISVTGTPSLGADVSASDVASVFVNVYKVFLPMVMR